MSRRPVVVLIVGLLILGVSMAPTYAAVFQWVDYKTMAQLVEDKDFIQVGDKIFDDWRYRSTSYAPPGGGVQDPDPAAIKVYYGQLPNGDIVLQYHAGYSAWGGGSVDAFWEYTVRTETGAPLIHDWSMSLVAFGPVNGGGSSIFWSETLYASPPPDNIITAGVVSNIVPYNTFKEVLDDSYSKIWVVKNLSLSSDPANRVHVSVLQQTWSQVPEASSFALFGLGFVGLGLFRRFRKR